MALMETPVAEIGSAAAEFELQGVDGKIHNLASARGENGLVVMFICNHCPYVKAVLDQIVQDAAELAEYGVGTVAVMSNDVAQYPEDDFVQMKKLSDEKGFSFPFVIDKTQEVARKYGAVCTPDFFGFDRDLKLQYRGRIVDPAQKNAPGAKRELFEAMREIAESGSFSGKQFNSIGCNIKWAHE